MDAADFLRAVPLFAETLDEAKMRSLAAQSRPAFFRAGTNLMAQGEFGAAMFVITEGEVAVTFTDAEAREQTVAKLGPRDIVGEMSLFTGDRRTATVTALTNVQAIEIGKAALEKIFAQAPALLDTFAGVLAKRQKELSAAANPPAADTSERFTRGARKVFTQLFRR
jgi:CRP-like cAMP-binding protein